MDGVAKEVEQLSLSYAPAFTVFDYTFYIFLFCVSLKYLSWMVVLLFLLLNLLLSLYMALLYYFYCIFAFTN